MKILTVDVGGTAIKYAVMDEQLNMTVKSSIPTPKDDFEIFIECLYDIYEEHRHEVEGISVSMPGIIDSKSGYAYTGGTLTYNNAKPIAEILSKKCGTKVYVENDGKCAILSEMWKGSLADCNSGIVYLFGTGLGGGIMIDRKLYKGRNFCAGEFSYVNSNSDKFGEEDCMAGIACSVTGLIKTAEQRTGIKNLDGRKIFDEIERGNTAMRDVLEEFSMRAAINIFNLNIILDVDRIALGGGISRQNLLLECVKRNLQKCIRNETVMKYNPSVPMPEI
ncbi:MAG: ROK family protein, partial [Acutalibacteraceae bacterium]